MAMSEEHREAIKNANKRRAYNCPGCGGYLTFDVVDGSQCGGLPGINYKVCNGCGRTTAIVRRPPRRYKF